MNANDAIKSLLEAGAIEIRTEGPNEPTFAQILEMLVATRTPRTEEATNPTGGIARGEGVCGMSAAADVKDSAGDFATNLVEGGALLADYLIEVLPDCINQHQPTPMHAAVEIIADLLATSDEDADTIRKQQGVIDFLSRQLGLEPISAD